MNERIKELLAQAISDVDYIHHGLDAEQLNEDLSQMFIPDVFAKRFAELIAKECAELCDRFQARNVGMQPAECAGAIKQMFGVKE